MIAAFRPMMHAYPLIIEGMCSHTFLRSSEQPAAFSYLGNTAGVDSTDACIVWHLLPDCGSLLQV